MDKDTQEEEEEGKATWRRPQSPRQEQHSREARVPRMAARHRGQEEAGKDATGVPSMPGPAATLLSDISPPELWGTVCFQPPVLWGFVVLPEEMNTHLNRTTAMSRGPREPMPPGAQWGCHPAEHTTHPTPPEIWAPRRPPRVGVESERITSGTSRHG